MRARDRGTALALTLVGAGWVVGAGCASGASPSDAAPAPQLGVGTVDPVTAESPLAFSCVDLEGDTVSTATVEGRVTVLLFITSYDPASTAEAEFLRDLLHTHAPKFNVVAFSLEREENKPLMQGFAAAAKLEYPICIADADTIAGRGTFAGMNSVPSVLILDRTGRPKYRFIGLQKSEELEAAITGVE